MTQAAAAVVHDLTTGEKRQKHKASNAAEGDVERGANKKPRATTALEESMKLSKVLEDLTKRKNELTEMSRRTMDSDWKKLAKADCVETYLFNTDHKEADWVCQICVNDFTPLRIADPDATSTAFLYHCEQCGATSCFKCVLKQATLNPHNNLSIGYTCGVCRFYNCNKINRGASPNDRPSALETASGRVAGLSVMPYPSGFSTVRPEKAKGEKLPTSHGVSSNADHVRNEEERQATFVMLVEEARLAREEYAYSPGSPQYVDVGSPPPYVPTSPHY